jgi:hypothetical protein
MPATKPEEAMVLRVSATPGGGTTAWLPAQPGWTDPGGTVWTRATPRQLTEADARRFAQRSSTRVGIERTPPGISDVEWLDPASQKAYWDRHIAGHVEDGTGRCTPDENGITYHVSSWRDPGGHRLILVSEMC